MVGERKGSLEQYVLILKRFLGGGGGQKGGSGLSSKGSHGSTKLPLRLIWLCGCHQHGAGGELGQRVLFLGGVLPESTMGEPAPQAPPTLRQYIDSAPICPCMQKFALIIAT